MFNKEMRLTSLLLTLAFLNMGFSPSGYFYTRKGNQLYGEKSYREAEKYYRKAQLKDPLSPEISYNLGNIHFRNGEFERAASEYKTVIEGENDELKKSSLYNLGNSLYMIGSKSEASGNTEGAVETLKGAVDAYKKSLSLDEKDGDVIHNLTLAEEKLQKLAKEEKKEREKKDKKGDKKEEKKKEEKRDEGKGDPEQKGDQTEDKERGEKEEKGEPNPDKKEGAEKEPEKNAEGEEKKKGDKKKSEGEPGEQNRGEQREAKSGEGITRREAEAILDALKGEENKLQKAFRRKNSEGAEVNVRQDW